MLPTQTVCDFGHCLCHVMPRFVRPFSVDDSTFGVDSILKAYESILFGIDSQPQLNVICWTEHNMRLCDNVLNTFWNVHHCIMHTHSHTIWSLWEFHSKFNSWEYSQSSHAEEAVHELWTDWLQSPLCLCTAACLKT